MPTNPFTAAILEAFALAPPGVVYLETLQIHHPSVSPDIYLVRDRAAWTLKDEGGVSRDFVACSFTLALPPSGDNGLQQLTISVDNIDLTISDFLTQCLSYTTPVVVTYRPYRSDDPNTPQMVPPLKLYYTDIEIGDIEVVGTATFADILNRPFPAELYDRIRFPGLANT